MPESTLRPDPQQPSPDSPAAQQPVPTIPSGAVKLPAPYSPAMDTAIADAKQDLAQRSAGSADQITVQAVYAVVWPDSSLGCPQPGMAYQQVLVEGVLVQLELGGTIYSYHGDGQRPLFLCKAR